MSDKSGRITFTFSSRRLAEQVTQAALHEGTTVQEVMNTILSAHYSGASSTVVAALQAELARCHETIRNLSGGKVAAPLSAEAMLMFPVDDAPPPRTLPQKSGNPWD